MRRARDVALWSAASVGAWSLLYPRAVELLLQRNLAALRAGDPEPLLKLDADDVRFTFPGTSSWAGTISSKEELRGWIGRFLEIGLQLHADEVVVSGPPWNTTIALRCSDHLDAADGTRVYENRAVLWGRVAWGLLREYEVYEDTERSLALDAWLNEQQGTAMG